ncbi:type II secretion system F family protein [Acidocella aminolytica]|jgi:general secretion pathway protein F|uniref:Secretion system type II protein F n=1 Tax=Acidocella aminolytica 101 = DSM 11237 TaxID=1120923 RepID=A0A0D6PDY0_9PROT|nr:type II secretion system F family protein [Acidocella aminolytica]GAN79408.1 secretion system type II protein F [Acidocella aminolytica 101 = DSM 11237]GBQ39277.1 type II secretion system protein [Acidocella aminolytica 101 = DSM 11237]SHE40507.1 general secretion pathway protein F [Acidocella aminolytica 101 = DSM 11237]
MPLFTYRALEPDGTVQRGRQDAPSAADLATQLQKRGAMVLGISPVGRSGGLLALELGGTSLRRGELTEATRELASLLTAGQDIDRALRLMAEEAPNKRIGAVLGRVRDSVRDGMPLAKALQRDPKSFPRLYIGLVRAGEAGGDLAGTLERLAGLLERQRSLTAAVQSAMIYPAILLLAAIGSIVLLLTQVLPQFVPLFAENGLALPASTAFLLGMGNAVSAYGLYGLLAMAALGLGLRQALTRPEIRLVWDRLMLRLPLTGPIAQEILAARLSRTLGMLLINGVALLPALAIVQEVLGNKAAQKALGTAAESAKGGHGMSRALGATGIFPSRLIHLLKLGEETAQLGPLSLRAADMFEERTRLALQRLVALLVPAITIFMGATVAGIVSSLLLAMLSLNDAAQ